jgi:hypothetical protein
MELFIPSVLLLLLAAAVIFFILPRFGAPVLALISVGLLAFGIYQHMNAFGAEYRLSTWQYNFTSYGPFIMVGGVLLVIGFYLLSLLPFGGKNTGTTAPTLPEMPTVAEMPNANTATNAVTAGVNNALKGITNIAGTAAAAVGVGNATKPANNKGLGAPAVAAANQAVNAVNKAANTAITGVTNAITGVANTLMGNKPANKPANTGALGGLLGGNSGNNKGKSVAGLGFPLSQV